MTGLFFEISNLAMIVIFDEHCWTIDWINASRHASLFLSSRVRPCIVIAWTPVLAIVWTSAIVASNYQNRKFVSTYKLIYYLNLVNNEFYMKQEWRDFELKFRESKFAIEWLWTYTYTNLFSLLLWLCLDSSVVLNPCLLE